MNGYIEYFVIRLNSLDGDIKVTIRRTNLTHKTLWKAEVKGDLGKLNDWEILNLVLDDIQDDEMRDWVENFIQENEPKTLESRRENYSLREWWAWS